jgi:NAD(P)H-hydrate epimerase
MKDWDRFTLLHEPIASIDLMERAASRCTEWIRVHFHGKKTIQVFCGRGNNGGDGLAMARQLHHFGYSVFVYILPGEGPGTPDFQANLKRLSDQTTVAVLQLEEGSELPAPVPDSLVIDALFGSGLNKPVGGIAAALIRHINHSTSEVISIDIPSGLFIDQSSLGFPVIKATYTLTFQCQKLALLVQENAVFTGQCTVLDIGLHPLFPGVDAARNIYMDAPLVKSIYRPRSPFAHKGNFGHALLIAGSYGKMGAAVLAAKAALRTGAGLLTCYLPACGYEIMQTSLPEAMVLTDEHHDYLVNLPDNIEKYNAIGVGPGLGRADATVKMMSFITRRYSKPLVIDADGLNCLSEEPQLIPGLPSSSILTPHPKEFERLFGPQANDFESIRTARTIAAQHKLVIVLKGHHTIIATPGGALYVNSTGNAGMAKGGSGDVLTGIITALVAQHYDPVQAAILGVYLHGRAGDLAAAAFSKEAMIATDIIDCLSPAFLELAMENQ